MKRAGMTVLTVFLVFMLTQSAQSQNLRMVADINAANTLNELVVSGRTVFNGKIHFIGNDGSRKTMYTLDGGGASMLLSQLDYVSDVYNTGSLMMFWADDGKFGPEPWRSDGTVSGSFLLKNLNTTPAKKQISRSYLNGGYETIGSMTYIGALESTIVTTTGLVMDFGLYQTDGTATGTVEIYDDLDVQKMIALDGNLIIDALDNLNTGGYGRELFIFDGGSTVPIGTMTAGQWGAEDDNPYTQWYSRHIYAIHEPITAAHCAFFNTRAEFEGNELWCTDGSGLRQVTGLSNGAHSTYPVFMTQVDGVLYFVGLDVNNDSELWSFPLTDPMNSGIAVVVANINPTGSSEPAWLTAYNGELYFSAYTEPTGRELYRFDGTAVHLVADIAPGSASSHPNYDPTDWRPVFSELRDYGTPGRFSMTEYNGKLYFAANDGIDGIELWSHDAATNTTTRVWDINAGSGNSDPHFLTVYNDRLYFTAYTPQYGRAWYEYDPGGSSVNQPPVAMASAPSISGLTVQFSSSGSYDPDGSITGYAWDFGDGTGSSGQANPSCTYAAAGTYTATLTVTDNGNATGTDNVTVTVSVTQTGAMYIASQVVTRVSLPGNKIAAEDVVVIREYPGGQPVEGAVVTASYYSATTGTVSGTTDANGEVTLTSVWDRNPVGTWCFNVTGVQKTGFTYDYANNAVPTEACEGVPKQSLQPPRYSEPSAATCFLHQNYPNPFGSAAVSSNQTTIQFRLEDDTHVSLRVFNAFGKLVQTVFEGYANAGRYLVSIQADDLPSGTYYCRMNTSNGTKCIRMLLQK